MMHTPHRTRTHYFDLPFLQQTFALLRYEYPSLALTVQNLTASTHALAQPKQRIAINLEATIVSEIINALSEIGDQACEDKHCSKERLIEIRAVLLEWLIYAQQFLVDEKSA